MAAVVAVEEMPLLRAVYRIIRRIEVEDDLWQRWRLRLHEHVDRASIHGGMIDRELLERAVVLTIVPVGPSD